MAACVVPVCDNPQDALGLCAAHYKRWYRNGEDADLVSTIGPGTRSAGSATPWNPWAYRVACPQCGMNGSTMPVGHDRPSWRCIECHLTFLPEATS